MTEILRGPTERSPIHRPGHTHGLAIGHLTIAGRRYSCGDVVAEVGRLDPVTRQLVWELALEREFPSPTQVDVLELMAEAALQQATELRTPPW